MSNGNFSRRSVLGGLAASPIAMPAAVEAAKMQMAQLEMARQFASKSDVAGVGFPMTGAANSAWSNPLIQAFHKAEAEYSRWAQAKAAVVQNPHTFADIHAMRSWSVATKERESIKRLVEMQTWWERERDRIMKEVGLL